MEGWKGLYQLQKSTKLALLASVGVSGMYIAWTDGMLLKPENAMRREEGKGRLKSSLLAYLGHPMPALPETIALPQNSHIVRERTAFFDLAQRYLVMASHIRLDEMVFFIK